MRVYHAPAPNPYGLTPWGRGQFAPSPLPEASIKHTMHDKIKPSLLTDRVKFRFWENVILTDPGKCWNWRGLFFDSGYGQFKIGDWPYRSHRMSYAINYGPITDPSMLVCHHCDNRACVNPIHLFLGTNADNVHDMIAKGRHGNALVTPEMRREMNFQLSCGHKITEIAKRFGVSRFTVTYVPKRILP